MSPLNTTRAVLFCLAFTALAACSSTNSKEDTVTADNTATARAEASTEAPSIPPVEKLYNSAAQKLDAGQYPEAIAAFDAVERQYPYSKWATKAQLMAAYAGYLDLNYDQAILGLDRFIQLHPSHENIDYAYYLRGLSFYEQISDVRRDQQMTRLALRNLNQVVERFPSTKYARDASLKIDLTLDHLAGKEMEIGRYYLTRNQYQAAIRRFQNVIDEYQTTTHVPEALHRLTEAYAALGILSEARKTAAVLGHNYPQSQWYKDSYKIISDDGEADPSLSDIIPETFIQRTYNKIF